MKFSANIQMTVFLLIAFGVYYSVRAPNWDEKESAYFSSTKKVTSPLPASPLEPGLGAGANNSETAAESSSQALREPAPTPLREALAGIPRAETVAAIFEALDQWDRDPAQRAEHARLLKSLQQDPQTSFEMLSEVLERLPRREFGFERAGVIELMQTLPTKRDETRTVALKEAAEALNDPRPDPMTAKSEKQRNVAMSTDHSMLLPIIAAQVFVQTARNSDEALQGILEVLQNQQDKHTREQIALKLADQFPEDRERILRQLKERQIDISAAYEEGGFQ